MRGHKEKMLAISSFEKQFLKPTVMASELLFCWKSPEIYKLNIKWVKEKQHFRTVINKNLDTV